MAYDYNEVCKVYDNVREADFQLVNFMIEKAGLNENSRILEIGCGTGNYLGLFEKMTKAEIWGIDQSKGMLDKSKEKCKRATLEIDNAVELATVPDESFDLVYFVDVIHHIKDIDAMFKNIKRVLRENGMVVIFSDSYEHIRNRLTTKYFPETLEVELNRYQDTPILMESLKLAGFKNIDSGRIEVGVEEDYGPKLIEIAMKKGYSMFGPLSEGTINEGIERIKADMEKGSIVYEQRAPYVVGVK